MDFGAPMSNMLLVRWRISWNTVWTLEARSHCVVIYWFCWIIAELLFMRVEFAFFAARLFFF